MHLDRRGYNRLCQLVVHPSFMIPILICLVFMTLDLSFDSYQFLPCSSVISVTSGAVCSCLALLRLSQLSRWLIPPHPSQRAHPQGLGGKLDARDEDDVGGEETAREWGERRRGSGRPTASVERSAFSPVQHPIRPTSSPNDGRLERCRNHVGEPQEDQGIAREVQRERCPRRPHPRAPEQGRYIDENRK